MAFRWGYSDYVTEDVTITANSAASGYAASNVLDNRISRKYRSTGDSTEWVMFDAGAGNTLDPKMIAIIGHNITDGATIKWQANATDSWGTPSLDQAITHASGIMWNYQASAQSYRYHRFYVEDASNPDTYIEIGKIMLLLTVDMTEYPQTRMPRKTVDTSLIRRSRTGQVYGSLGVQYLAYEWNWPIMPNGDRVNLEAIWEAHGKAKPLITIPNTGDTTVPAVYGHIVEDLDINHVIAYQWAARVVFEEAL